MSELSVIIEKLQELERMLQLNSELVDHLVVIYAYITDNNIPIPNEEKFNSLMNKTRALLREITYSQKPSMIQYVKLSDDSYHDDKSDKKLPEP